MELHQQARGQGRYYSSIISRRTVLGQRKPPEEALADFDRVVTARGRWTTISRAHLLSQIPGEHEQVQKIAWSILGENPSLSVQAYTTSALCFLGEPDLLREYARTVMNTQQAFCHPDSLSASIGDCLSGRHDVERVAPTGRVRIGKRKMQRPLFHWRRLYSPAVTSKARGRASSSASIRVAIITTRFPGPRAFLARMEHDTIVAGLDRDTVGTPL